MKVVKITCIAEEVEMPDEVFEPQQIEDKPASWSDYTLKEAYYDIYMGEQGNGVEVIAIHDLDGNTIAEW